MENNKRPTQCERIKDYLEYHGSITSLQAIMDLGILRLASRISEMKKAGVNIASKPKVVKNRFGEDCRITEYFLAD